MPGLMYSCTFRYSPLVSCVEAITVYLYAQDILASTGVTHRRAPSAELTLCSKSTWNGLLLECTRTVSAQRGCFVVREKIEVRRTTVRLMPIALQPRLQPGLFSPACSFRGLRSDSDTFFKVYDRLKGRIWSDLLEHASLLAQSLRART